MEITRWWLCIGALALAACGGGGDDDTASGTTDAGAATGDGSDLDDGTTPTVATGAGVDTAVDDDAGTAAAGTTDDETTDAETTDDETTDDADEPGPALEPTVAFVIPASSTSGTRGGTVAVSPTGDRVAAMSFDDGLIGSLTVFDAATGEELAATTDERLAGALFWAADDRLLSGATQGEVWAWDTTTLEPASDEPLSSGDNFCGNSNGIMFDPGAGALFLLARDFCRLDVTTGDVIVHGAEPDLLGDLRVAIGGDEVFLKWVTDDNVLMTRTVDAATLETLVDAEGGPNYIVAASGNGRIEELSGNDKVVQPSGREIGFFGPVVEPSAGGGYYFGDSQGVLTVISSVDGSTVGTIDTSGSSIREVDWSADDTVMVTRTDEGVTVYEIG